MDATGPGSSTRATTPPGLATKMPAPADSESSVAAKAIAPPSAMAAPERAPNAPASGAGNGSPVFATTESTPPSSRRIPLVVARSATWPALDATGRRNPSRRSPSAVASPERRRICGAAAAGTACATSSAASNAPRARMRYARRPAAA